LECGSLLPLLRLRRLLHRRSASQLPHSKAFRDTPSAVLSNPCENTTSMLFGRDLPAFRKRLLSWFRQFQRDLPWRRNKDPYRVWLSEIMLQQTRVAAVIPYYERFLERFPDVRTLAEAPEEDVLRLWSGLGYYSRARNLQAAAKEIVAKHVVIFPRDPNTALALPGIGPYTAAAILSIAYDAKLAVLDGNVGRVIARLDAVRGNLRESRRWQALQARADELLDRKSPGDWNQAMMELGATMCTPRAPQCLLCPVATFCRARQLGIADTLPEKRKKRATVDVRLAAAVLLDPQGRTLLLPPPQASRSHTTHEDVATLVSKMWHFPTIAVESDATSELRQFLTKVIPPNGKDQPLRLAALSKARHAVTYRAITLLPYRVPLAKLPQLTDAKHISLAELVSPSALAVSNLTRKIARAALAEPAAVAAIL
jgi:A/G-specific adenine glycosylase